MHLHTTESALVILDALDLAHSRPDVVHMVGVVGTAGMVDLRDPVLVLQELDGALCCLFGYTDDKCRDQSCCEISLAFCRFCLAPLHVHSIFQS